jgi:choline-glycine betaine transporter
MNHLKYVLITCVFFIAQPFNMTYARPESKPPPPNPGHRNPPDFSFPGLGIEDFIPYFLLVAVVFAFFVFRQNRKVSIG